MKIFFLSCVLLALSGCGRKFAPLYEQARQDFENKNYVGAVDALNLALPRWHDSDGGSAKGLAYELLGKSYHKLRNIDKASDAFEQAIVFSTAAYESAYTLGVIRLAKGQYNEAAKAFRDALRMRKDDPLALVGLGNALYALRKFDEAQVMYEQVLNTSPGVKEAMEYLKLTQEKRREQSRPRRKIIRS